MTFLTIFLTVWFAVSAVGVLSFCAISSASALLPSFAQEGVSKTVPAEKMAKRDPSFGLTFFGSTGGTQPQPLIEISRENDMAFFLNGKRFLATKSPAKVSA